MRNQSLSSFVRQTADQHFEGPIPAEHRERIRIIESAERSMERDMSPLERAMKSLRYAMSDVEGDTLHIEALHQLIGEGSDHNSLDKWTKERDRHRLIALESATYAADQLAKIIALLTPAEADKAA